MRSNEIPRDQYWRAILTTRDELADVLPVSSLFPFKPSSSIDHVNNQLQSNCSLSMADKGDECYIVYSSPAAIPPQKPLVRWRDMNAAILGKCTASEISEDLPFPGRCPPQPRQIDSQPDNADATGKPDDGVE
ncbi:hypothetical protein AZE42_02217 [Rhizopogon vesiculosus]|uniref:Uncharacterized protein n=1 Tax=Rhizopogon vesiculosus TaxID=180088 RepID=A0A1J8Q646_9AGAM|nr:hypothetical protein AZE42_02217 [Rhizopogon vesiculosus]